eukprot:966114-Pleurochrysis_carterae.AAC.2
MLIAKAGTPPQSSPPPPSELVFELIRQCNAFKVAQWVLVFDDFSDAFAYRHCASVGIECAN